MELLFFNKRMQQCVSTEPCYAKRLLKQQSVIGLQ